MYYPSDTWVTTYPMIKQSYWHMEVLLPLCVLWDKAIKDFCTDFPQERMWVPWEATHQLTKLCNYIAAVSRSWVGDKQISVCLSALFPRINLPNQSRVMHWWSKSESHTRFRFRYLWIRIRFRLKSTRFRLQIRFHYTWIRIRNQIRIQIPTPDSESPQVWFYSEGSNILIILAGCPWRGKESVCVLKKI